MKLFLFKQDGDPLALLGEDVLQVLPPGEVQDEERGSSRALHRGRSLPILVLPFAPSSSTLPASRATFLLIRGETEEGLLQVDEVDGLYAVSDDDILALPAYLVPDGGACYDGLFPMGKSPRALIRRGCLRDAGSL